MSIENSTPASTARRSSRRGGSSRSGRELISTAVPVSAHAAKTASASNSDSGRPRPVTSRPVQCPSTSECGSRTAATIRRVIARASIRNLEWTDTTTTSSRSSSSGSWSSEPSSRMSHSMPVSSRNGAQVWFSAATTSSCSRNRSGDRPRATVSLGEWSVSTVHSWPRRAAVRPISSIGLPPSDQSECTWQSPLIRFLSSAPASPSVSGASAPSSSFRR